MLNLNKYSSSLALLLVAAFILIGAAPSDAVVRFGTPPIAVTNSNADYLNFVRYITVLNDSQLGATWEAGNDVTDKTPAEIQVIVDGIKALENTKLRQLFDDMNAAQAVNGQSDDFDFATINEAIRCVAQRTHATSKMREFNVKESYWYRAPGTTAPGWTTGRRGLYDLPLWGRILLDSSKLYRQKSNSPSTAYEAINLLCADSSRTGGECWGAAVACVWYGSAQAMGATRFNALYPAPVGLDMDFHFSNKWERNMRPAVDTTRLVYGDWVYWRNHNYGEITANRAYYDQHKPGVSYLSSSREYLLQGENAFYKGRNANGEDLFEGLGMQNLTRVQMIAALQSRFNEDLAPLIKAGKIDAIPDNKRNELILLENHKRLVQ